MPRPLIIKVTSHSSHPDNKVASSNNVEVIRGSSSKSADELLDLGFMVSHEGGSTSVQNLVNKYQSPTSSSLLKHKSKSLCDLTQQNKTSPEHKTTQDSLFHEDNHLNDVTFEERKQHFQQALSKFQNLPGNHVVKRSGKLESGNVREKAKMLLQSTKHDYFWFNEVVELLHQIVNDNTLVFTNDSEVHVRTRTVSTGSSSSQEGDVCSELNGESSLKVTDMASMYEEKVAQKPKLHVDTKNSVAEGTAEKNGHEPKLEQVLKLPLKYFGKDDEEESDDSTLTDTDENQIEDNFASAAAQGETVQDLIDTEPPNFDYAYDSNHADATDDTLETFQMQTATTEEAEQIIETIIKTIEECNNEIETLSTGNRIEATYLNKVLLEVLIHLDDLQIDDNEVVLSLRKKAFEFAQECIKKLKNKVFNDE